MWFLTFEVMPLRSSPELAVYGGAMVNCYIVRETLEQARGIALRMILDEGWCIIDIETEYELHREDCVDNSLQYFDQAMIDEEVFVFHTWPFDAPDTSEAD